MKKLNICVAYVSGDRVHARFCDSLAAVLQRYEVSDRIAVRSSPRLAQSRNDVIRNYLTKTHAQYLWMVDTDMEFIPETPEMLLEVARLGFPVVGGLCNSQSSEGPQPVMFDRKLERITEFEDNQLVEVGATGAACLLVRRGVLEKVASEVDSPHKWFEETVEDGKERGEDVTFCQRVRKAGFRIHVHTGIKVGHVKETVI